MADETTRPIRIQIPAELNLTQNEIDSLELVFSRQLVDVQSDVRIDDQPIESVNTTKLAVEVEVVGPSMSQLRKERVQSTATAAQPAAETPTGQTPEPAAGDQSAGQTTEDPGN